MQQGYRRRLESDSEPLVQRSVQGRQAPWRRAARGAPAGRPMPPRRGSGRRRRARRCRRRSTRPRPEPGTRSSSRRPRCMTSLRRSGGRPGPSSSTTTIRRSSTASAAATDAPARPFAGVVEQVAEHLLEVLAGAAEGELGRAGDLDRELAGGIDARRACAAGRPAPAQPRCARRSPRRSPWRARATDGGRPAGASARSGAAVSVASAAVATAGLVGQHRDRRLQAVRQIADMGARPLDHRLVVVEQRVELVGERPDLLGIVARPAAWPARSGSSARPRRMRRSGSRPKRTWISTAATTPTSRVPRPSDQQAVEALGLGVDLAPVAGDRVERTAGRGRAGRSRGSAAAAARHAARSGPA